VQLLIRSRNSSGRFVRSLVTKSITGQDSKFNGTNFLLTNISGHNITAHPPAQSLSSSDIRWTCHILHQTVLQRAAVNSL